MEPWTVLGEHRKHVQYSTHRRRTQNMYSIVHVAREPQGT